MEVNQGMNKMEEASETLNRMSDAAKSTLSDVSNRLMERSKTAASTTDAYVREYAWSSVALAALLGVAIGLMIRRS
jgi:ElaB/YqjD/DUF883 family membrane-anchored ribosome-binding protein